MATNVTSVGNTTILPNSVRVKGRYKCLSQITDTEQTDDTLFIDAVQKQGQTEVKTDECFSTLNVQGTPI